MNNNINDIENELSSLFNSDKKSWVRIYELLDEVEKEKLWEEEFSSFTQWVNHLANSCRVHVSLIWKRKKAGSVYAKYQERAAEKGQSVPTMDEVEISPDNFELIEKIAQGNSNIEDDLIQKSLKGDLKRKDLKDAWNTVKAEKNDLGQKATRINAHGTFVKSEQNEDAEDENKITAIDVVLALKDDAWMEKGQNKERPFTLTHYGRFHEKRVYKTMTEFGVNTGTSHHVRRIDVVALENKSNYDGKELLIHGIEIKVSKSDLESDHKMLEYKDFVDYLWFAVPEELVEVAKKVAESSVGIIGINKYKEAYVVRLANKNKPMMKQEALETALIKVL